MDEQSKSRGVCRNETKSTLLIALKNFGKFLSGDHCWKNIYTHIAVIVTGQLINGLPDTDTSRKAGNIALHFS